VRSDAVCDREVSELRLLLDELAERSGDRIPVPHECHESHEDNGRSPRRERSPRISRRRGVRQVEAHCASPVRCDLLNQRCERVLGDSALREHEIHLRTEVRSEIDGRKVHEFGGYDLRRKALHLPKERVEARRGSSVCGS